MKITRTQLRSLILESIRQNYVSHTFEPSVGDGIVNTNPQCKHYGSKGKVIKIIELPQNMGRAITYIVSNDGDTFKIGDILNKTLDQLEPNDE